MSPEVIQTIDYWVGWVVSIMVVVCVLGPVLGIIFIGFPIFLFRMIRSHWCLKKQQHQSTNMPQQLDLIDLC